MRVRPRPAAAALAVLVLSLDAAAGKKGHTFEDKEKITLWYNKVGPYNNPQETYQYFDLPFCRPDGFHRVKKKEGLGEILEGNELVDSNLDIKFKVDVPTTPICTLAIDKSIELEFIDAVQHLYWYQVYMDDLPQWGMVGEWVTDPENPEAAEALIYTHKNIDIAYEAGGNRIMQMNLTSENPKPIKRDTQLEFTYSVQWSELAGVKWEDRFRRYLDNSFFEHQIHWFSIFNSFMMVIFLTALVSMILMRTLRRDYAKYAAEEDDFDAPGANDDSGWKQVHGDVFRTPSMLALHCAAVGNGLQLTLLCIICICLAIIEHLYTGRGSSLTIVIVFYALTSVVGGFVSGSLYAQSSGPSWQKAMLLSATLFPGLVLGIAFLVNFVSWHYETLHAIPFGTMVIVLLIWVCVSIPLTTVGTLVGRNWCGEPNFPCRVNPIPRYVPDNPWFLRPFALSMLSGLLPFGSIFIEIYFVFTSFWNYKYYYVYGFMLLVFVILLIVSVCVTIVSTYFLLNAEDYRWHWSAITSAASTALYVYIYAIYYFFAKTKMSGVFQTTFYFGHTMMFCIGIGLVTGSIGFLAANMFVKRIYKNIKSD